MFGCSNAGCASRFIVKSIGFLVEDITSSKWRCLPCNYVYTLYGQEVPAGLPTDLNAQKPEPRKALHNKYNETQCSKCKQFVTPNKWIETNDGAYLCSLCFATCSNTLCVHNPITTYVVWDKDLQDWFCRGCWNTNSSRAKYGAARMRHWQHQFNHTRGIRMCRNPQCGQTDEGYNALWHYIPGHTFDPDYMRCVRCYKVWMLNQRDWAPGARRICCNPACGRDDETWPGSWTYEEGHEGDLDFIRCQRCHWAITKYGQEYHPERPVRECGNPNCDHTDLDPSIRWRYIENQSDDPLFVRCLRC